MKLSYKQKLFIYFFIVFAAFTVIIIFSSKAGKKATRQKPYVPRWTTTRTLSPGISNNII